MEQHPLNLAHQQHRRAEAHLLNNRYDEAMQCHHTAAELLLDAMKSTTSSVALESITLQHSYHLKQKDFIKIKKEQYERVRKAMAHLKSLGMDTFHNVQINDSSKVQVAIYKTLNETSSLLSLLHTSNDKDPEKEPVVKPETVEGKKIEKTQETVIEELTILNQSLHSLVEQLVLQIEVFKDENMTLKDRVSYLEKERIKYLNISPALNEVPRNVSNPVNETITPDVGQKMPIAKEPQQSKPATVERISQPHFDLSALKDV